MKRKNLRSNFNLSNSISGISFYNMMSSAMFLMMETSGGRNSGSNNANHYHFNDLTTFLVMSDTAISTTFCRVFEKNTNNSSQFIQF